MKRACIYGLSLLIFLQSCVGGLIITAFYANQTYIANNLCENRDKPQLHCNGQCILMQKLRKAQENEKKEVDGKIKETSYFFTSHSIHLINNSFTPVCAHLPNFDMRSSHYSFTIHNQVHRPPIV